MPNLNLNITQIRDNVQKTKDQLNKYDTQVNEYNMMLKKVDSCWMDNLTDSYIKTLERDQEEFDEFEQNVLDQIGVTEYFCNELDAQIAGYFEVGNLTAIKYIEQTTANSVQMLGEIASKISGVQSSISSLSIPASSGQRGAIMGLMSGIDLGCLNEVRDKINGVIRGINTTISNSRSKASSTPKQEVEDKPISLRSVTQTPNLNRTPEVHESHYEYGGSQKGLNIDNDFLDLSRIEKQTHRGSIADLGVLNEQVKQDSATRTHKGTIANANIDDSVRPDMGVDYKHKGDVKNSDLKAEKVEFKGPDYKHEDNKKTISLFDENNIDMGETYRRTADTVDLELDNSAEIDQGESYSKADNIKDAELESKRVEKIGEDFTHADIDTELSLKDEAISDVETYKHEDRTADVSLKNGDVRRATEYSHNDMVEEARLKNDTSINRPIDVDIAEMIREIES